LLAIVSLPDLSCVPYQGLERLRIRIEPELEGREAGKRSHESAVEVFVVAALGVVEKGVMGRFVFHSSLRKIMHATT
jgi:hypothetical protein